jgi:hypothetical protein
VEKISVQCAFPTVIFDSMTLTTVLVHFIENNLSNVFRPKVSWPNAIWDIWANTFFKPKGHLTKTFYLAEQHWPNTVWPKDHLIESSFSRPQLIERSFYRLKGQLIERSFDRKIVSSVYRGVLHHGGVWRVDELVRVFQKRKVFSEL